MDCPEASGHLTVAAGGGLGGEAALVLPVAENSDEGGTGGPHVGVL
jgi:hypothetical protein